MDGDLGPTLPHQHGGPSQDVQNTMPDQALLWPLPKSLLSRPRGLQDLQGITAQP